MVLVAGNLIPSRDYADSTGDSGPPPAATGIYVGQPKIYDDRSLQDMLNAIVSQLSAARFIDQNGVAQHIGTLQGASLDQSQFGFSAMGLPTASVATTATSGTPSIQQTTGTTSGVTAGTSNSTSTTNTTVAPSGLTTVVGTGGSGSTTSGDNSTTVTTTPGNTLQSLTTTPSVTPSLPVVPTTTTFTPPSAFSTSALSTLNEQLELSYEVANLQLLLGGALSDRFVRGTTELKRHTTIGFPISIDPPADKKYRDAIAEVEVTITNRSNGVPEAPSVITVLPREKTYNVASLTDKSGSIGGGLVTGVLSLGVSWLWGHKTYYVVQDQDTIALERASKVSGKAVIAWQFRPVLGEKTVRPGLRQTYAQMAFGGLSGTSSCDGTATIVMRWRALDPKTRTAGKILAESSSGPYPLSNFDLTPYARSIRVEDVGSGLITVRVAGDFMTGTRVRLGSAYLDATTPGFSLDAQGIRFTAAARLVASNQPVLVSRDGTESDIVDAQVALHFGGLHLNLPECAQPLPLPIAGGDAAAAPQPQLTIHSATSHPYDDSQSIVEIELDQDPGPAPAEAGPLVVLLADKLYGLGDAPYWRRDGKKLWLIVPSDALAKARLMTVKRLFWGPYYSAATTIAPPRYSFTKLTLLSSGDTTAFALTGSGLGRASVKYPQRVTLEPVSDDSDQTAAIFTLTKEQLKGLKQIVLADGNGSTKIVAIPDAAKPSTSTAPAFDKVPPIAPSVVATAVTISGTNLDAVKAILFLGKPVPFRWAVPPGTASTDSKQQLTVQLPAGAAAAEGTIALDITFSDTTPATRVLLTIQKPVPKVPGQG